MAVDTNSISHYYQRVIRNYRDRDAQAVAERRRVSKFPEDIQRRAQGKLMILNNAKDLNDLRVPPGNRLEALSGDRAGHSTAFASIGSGVSASYGTKGMLLKWR